MPVGVYTRIGRGRKAPGGAAARPHTIAPCCKVCYNLAGREGPPGRKATDMSDSLALFIDFENVAIWAEREFLTSRSPG